VGSDTGKGGSLAVQRCSETSDNGEEYWGEVEDERTELEIEIEMMYLYGLLVR